MPRLHYMQRGKNGNMQQGCSEAEMQRDGVPTFLHEVWLTLPFS